MIALIKNSVAAKVSLIISLMVFMSAFVVGALLYYAGNRLVESAHFSDLENRSDILTNIFRNELKQLSHLGERLSFYDREANSFNRIERMLEDSNSINDFWIGYRIYKSNGMKLSDRAPNFSEKRPKEFIPLTSNVYFSEVLLNGGEYPYVIVKIVTQNFLINIFYDFHGFLENKINLNQSREKSFLLLANKKGDYIFHPQVIKRYSHTKAIKYNMTEDFTGVEVYDFLKGGSHYLHKQVNFLNQETLFVFSSITLNGNKVFHLALGEERRLRAFHSSFLKTENFIISIFMLMGFSFLGWLFTRYLLRNLDEITHQAKQFTQGEHDIDIQVRSGDEIGILALTFQGMIRQVNERTRILRKSERSIREAKDQAEQALSSKSHLLEDLRKQKAEIERVSKDKDDLLAIVSHDLKNPLAVIETSMDLILEDDKYKLSTMGTDLIRRCKNSARVALNLITDLLDLSRLEGGIRLDFERFSLQEMIASVVDGFYLKSTEKEISIEVHQENNYDLVADYGRMIQVLSNLLGNSLKFTPKGGKITINIKEYQSDHAYDGSYRGLELTISDTGPGIPEDKLDSIFNKFEQARKKDRETGTGLGLTISRNICELHNGEISVSSPPGKGAIFTIKLPRLLLSEELKKGGTKSSYNVLVVNDEEEFRKKAMQEFNNLGYQVTEAKNGEELLTILEDSHPDLILLDSDMPVKNGIEAIGELKQLGVSLPPIILISDLKIMRSESFQEVKGFIGDVISAQTPMSEIVARGESLIQSEGLSFDKKLDPLKKTILIVDDEEGIRTLMQEVLSSMGFNCMGAKSGIEALFFVQKYHVDLVVSDIRMTEVDGLKLTKTIHSLYPDTEVMLMSANVDTLSQNIKKKLGVSHLFSKPFDVEEVCESIRTLLDDVFLEKERGILRERGEGSDGLQDSQKEKNRMVLLIDDSEDMQTLFKALLRKENLDLTVASDGFEALDFCKNNQYDTIFLDMNMPEMNGEETARKIRLLEKDKKYAASHLVLLTADAFKNSQKIGDMGFDSYVQKPLSKDKLLKEIYFEK